MPIFKHIKIFFNVNSTCGSREDCWECFWYLSSRRVFVVPNVGTICSKFCCKALSSNIGFMAAARACILEMSKLFSHHLQCYLMEMNNYSVVVCGYGLIYFFF